MSGKNQKYKPANSRQPIANSSKKAISHQPIAISLLSVILIITFWCYHYSLGNEFTSWDDVRFITQNIFIKSFSPDNLKMMLFHVTGNFYNPLTMISYAINYHFSGMQPESYYLTNILIHLLNSCLMFFLVLTLLKAMEKIGYFNIQNSAFKIQNYKEWLAFFCTLAYAVHPMHVESVSWIAERKDVLYTLFYFIGLILYVRYTQGAKFKWMAYFNICLALLCVWVASQLSGHNFPGWNTNIFIFFFIVLAAAAIIEFRYKKINMAIFYLLEFYLLSLFSKPMAVVFPFSLLAIDVLLKRDKILSIKKIVREKLPFILIFILSAITTYYSQKASGAVREEQSYSFFQRFLFASYDFCIYLLKAFIPIRQSSYYPYPTDVSLIFYLSPLIALLLLALPLYFAWRAGNNPFRITLFGVLFYFFNIILVSQIISFGPTMMSERYSYVCYFGIFFPITCFAYQIIRKIANSYQLLAISFISVYMLFFAVLCYQRTFVWHNSETLWTDVVEKYPHRVMEAYNSLGNYYFAHRDIEKSYNNYEEALSLGTADAKVYCNMGILMRAKKQYQSALNYYTAALKLDSNDAVTYVDRAIVYSVMGRYEPAIKDYRHSLAINPYSEGLLGNMAFTFLNAQQFDSAITYYSRVIQINPTDAGYFHYRGVAEFEKGSIKPAMDDFMQNLRITPHDSECMYLLSKTYYQISDFNNAYRYAQMAQDAQYAVPSDYIRLLQARR